MIAIVYPQFYGVGGIARYLDSFLANLPADHPTIYLITGDEHRVKRQYANVELIHLPFSSNRFNLFFWSLKARKVLNQLYKQRKIQYVNLHIPPLIPGLFIPQHIPLILTVHTTYLGMSGQYYSTPYFVSQWSALEIYFKRKMESHIFSQAQEIITLTEQSKQEIVSYGFKKPITVVANGVDTALFSQDASIAKEVDVLFCGRIERRKGSRAMVAVCKALIENNNNIRILIVGYGDDDSWVNAQLSRYKDNITLTGKVSFSETQHYYAISRVYVSTSYYEGLPGTCLEAMAMGLPAITWDFLFYKGLIEQDKTGYLITPNNITVMSMAIVNLLEDEATRALLASNTRPHIEQYYHWKILAKKILAVFVA